MSGNRHWLWLAGGAVLLLVCGAVLAFRVETGSSGARLQLAREAVGAEGDASLQAEIKALRLEVAGLRKLVGAVALADRQGVAAPSSEPARPPSAARQRVVPPGAGLTPDEIMEDFATGALDMSKTRAVTSALEERLSRQGFAGAQAQVEEVDCRGRTCRLRLSVAEDADTDELLLELAGIFPDGQGFQEFAPAGNHRRMITSHQLERRAAAGR